MIRKLSTALRGRSGKALVLSAALSMVIAVGGTLYVLQRERDAAASTPARIGASIFAYPGQPDDWAVWARDVDLVVQGTVTEVLPPVWTTPDGHPPASPEERDPLVHIRTPMRLSVERVFKGAAVGNSLVFSVVGGRIGDTEWRMMEGTQGSYQVGDRVILLLRQAKPGQPAALAADSGLFPSIGLVIEGDMARGPVKRVPLSRVIRQLEQLQP